MLFPSRKLSLRLSLVSVALVQLSIAHTATAAVVISSNNMVTNTNSFSSGSATDAYTGTSIPAHQLLDATVGDFYSRAQVFYSGSSAGATLSYDVSQKRDSHSGDSARAFNNTMYFTVSENMAFQASGFYDVTDVATAGRVFFGSFLRNKTTNTWVFDNRQQSVKTVNESFVLGKSEGDSFNFNTGNLSGILTAGDTYEWYWEAALFVFSESDGGASAAGNMTLVLGDGGLAVTAVPEPASMAMWGLGAIGLACARKQRRQIEFAGC